MLAIVAALLVSGGVGWLTRAPSAAGAAVVHVTGFPATVLGWTSWYGSYGMGELGVAWCIDHGSRAPDAAYGYAPTEVADQPVAVRTAIAWVLGRHGNDVDAVGAAALMLVLHDLMGAVYPHGALDVDSMTVDNLAGFGGAEADVLGLARAIKSEALGHSGLDPPLALTLATEPTGPGDRGTLDVRITDAAGQGVPGITVTVSAGGAVLDPGAVVTGADGRAAVGYSAAVGANTFSAEAVVPDLVLQAFASSTLAAQRVARPAAVTLSGHTEFEGVPPTTTTTIAPTTTTTIAPATTSTSTSTTSTTTSTTAPPAAPTTAAPTTASPTTATPPTAPPAPTIPPPAAPQLARTGTHTPGLALVGGGLIAMGAGLLPRRREWCH